MTEPIQYVSSSGVAETDPRLAELKQYGPGWHFGDGEGVSPSVARRLSLLTGWAALLDINADLYPGVDGSGAIVFYGARDKAGNSLEVIVAPDGSMELHAEQGYGVDGSHMDMGGTTALNNVFDALTDVCLSSDFSTSDTSTPTPVGSLIWRSTEAPRPHMDSLFSSTNALAAHPRALAYVLTPSATTSL